MEGIPPKEKIMALFYKIFTKIPNLKIPRSARLTAPWPRDSQVFFAECVPLSIYIKPFYAN